MENNEEQRKIREEIVAKWKEQYEQEAKEGKKEYDWRRDLHPHWLRELSIETLKVFTSTFIIGIPVMFGIFLWVNKSLEAIDWKMILVIAGGSSSFIALILVAANLDETPLRKYPLIRDICESLQNALRRGPPAP